MTLPKHLLRDVLANVLYAAGLTRGRDPRSLRIVTFHRVLPARELAEYPLPGLAVTPEELAWFVAFFAEQFECGRLDVLHERWAAGETFARPPLAITFDDGQLDNFVHARPVLDGARVSATFFVPTEAAASGRLLWHDRAAYAVHSWLKRDREAAREAIRGLGVDPERAERGLPSATVGILKTLDADARERFILEAQARAGSNEHPEWDGMMNPEQLRELARGRHEVGSHSHTHPILPLVSDETLMSELVESRVWLERETGVGVTSFCYPNGDHDARVVDQTARAGYVRGVTTQFGVNRPGRAPFELTRFDIQSETARSARNRLSRARVAWRMSGFHPGLK
jgi:peptidoglycan/xylan/chitin deacetylase (PgdA/CDA1 family)